MEVCAHMRCPLRMAMGVTHHAHFGALQVAQTANHLLMWFYATAASVQYAICLEANTFVSEAQLALVHCIAT